MKAMILAAGKGTRVQPRTYDIPKPMIPLVRKPVLESIIELLRRHGVDRIVINTSHLAPTIEEYFRDGAAWGVEIAYSFEDYVDGGEIKAQALGSAVAFYWETGTLADDTGRILRFQDKPKREEAISTPLNTGIHVFEPGIFDHILSGATHDIGGSCEIDDARRRQRQSEDHHLPVQFAMHAGTLAGENP